MSDLKDKAHVAWGEAIALQDQPLMDTGRTECRGLGPINKETGGQQGKRKGRKNNCLKPPLLSC